MKNSVQETKVKRQHDVFGYTACVVVVRLSFRSQSKRVKERERKKSSKWKKDPFLSLVHPFLFFFPLSLFPFILQSFYLLPPSLLLSSNTPFIHIHTLHTSPLTHCCLRSCLFSLLSSLGEVGRLRSADKTIPLLNDVVQYSLYPVRCLAMLFPT